MQTFGFVSLLLIVVIALGAYKVWRFLVNLFSKPFKAPNLTRIRKTAFIIVALTVCAMLTPFLLPFNSTIRTVIFASYLVYTGLGLSQIYDWVRALLNRGNTPAAK